MPGYKEGGLPLIPSTVRGFSAGVGGDAGVGVNVGVFTVGVFPISEVGVNRTWLVFVGRCKRVMRYTNTVSAILPISTRLNITTYLARTFLSILMSF
jgi:hypothetical protein